MSASLLHRDERGVWVTADGRTSVLRAGSITMCDNPHPMRTKVDGRWVGSYCGGGEEHDYISGWLIEGDLHGLRDETYGTLAEARAALAGALAKEAGA